MQCANRPAFMTTVHASCGRMLVSGFSRSKRAPSCRYLFAHYSSLFFVHLWTHDKHQYLALTNDDLARHITCALAG